MIIDCCTFLNELDLLEARLEYLNNHVDYFVVVESNYTFNGNEKPYHIKNNMDRFAKYGEKLIYVPIEVSIAGYDFTDLAARNQWAMERQQRNAMTLPLDRFDPNDVVIFGDIDEIPHRNAIATAADLVRKGERVIAFEQDFFYFNFDQVNQNKWPGTLITTVQQLRAFTPQTFRDHRYSHPRIGNGGYHLSYWGSPRQIQYKIDNFSHQEINKPEFNNVENIIQSIAEGKDLYNRPEEIWLRTDRTTLDPDMLQAFERLEYKV